jgi:Polyketide cyclase / dehydrase and lipid transport
MLPRVEYSVTAPTTPEQLWDAFCDLTRLLHRGLYSDASWTEGTPWQLGSRLRYVVVKPVAAVVSSVVTFVDPPKRVSIINHGLGVTADQIVTFAPIPNGMTRVTMTVDFVGQSPVLSPQGVADALTFVTRDALDSMLARWQQKSSPPTQLPKTLSS